ncbi:MAG: LysM peptidoglycan-binding domain-containing protein [Polyangiales bacterium]
MIPFPLLLLGGGALVAAGVAAAKHGSPAAPPAATPAALPPAPPPAPTYAAPPPPPPPAPTYAAPPPPAPTYAAPPPPAPTYAPAPTYTAPAPTYAPPPQVYVPVPVYTPPMPDVSFAVPGSMYGAPAAPAPMPAPASMPSMIGNGDVGDLPLTAQAEVQKAIFSGTNSVALEELANRMEPSGFPVVASKLRARASYVRANPPMAPMPSYQPAAVAQPLAPPTLAAPIAAPPPYTPPVYVPPIPPAAPVLQNFPYTIKSGDTMWRLASKLTGNGARWTEFLKLNPKLRVVGDQVRPFNPGQVIILPAAWSATLRG